MPEGAALPRVPVNGDGHLIAHVPDAAGPLWLTGASFDRARGEPELLGEDAEANRERLARLHPAAAQALAAQFEAGEVQAWAGVRCASHDRRPLVGPLDPDAPQGPWLCTAMGSRGLSFAALCAELLAARWHGEPWPLPAALAGALDTRRIPRLQPAPSAT
jgi:tRNA 5-methylaminomethyl-2-thiouridine biosynthesis bifunctional protein